MTIEQVALAVIVAVVTAFATSVLNNFFELRRLQTMWKQETDERIANYRKERLQERLASIEAYVESLLRILMPSSLLFKLGQHEVKEKVRESVWTISIAFAVSRAVGDERLTAAIHNLDSLMREAHQKVADDKAAFEDTEWRHLYGRILGVCGEAFSRVDELLEEAYVEGVRR
jgi:hypothetical protein